MLHVSVVAVPTTIGVLLLVGFIGNLIVIYVTITTKRVAKHPLHSLLVLNLAVADLVYLFSSAPYQERLAVYCIYFAYLRVIVFLPVGFTPFSCLGSKHNTARAYRVYITDPN